MRGRLPVKLHYAFTSLFVPSRQPHLLRIFFCRFGVGGRDRSKLTALVKELGLESNCEVLILHVFMG